MSHVYVCGRFGVGVVVFVNVMEIYGESFSVILGARFWKTKATAWSGDARCETSAEN